jgi:lipopolysaccharide/colanic/teichoic acid biosynthesis glycosyltransferase
MLKRIFDLIFSLFGLILLLPLFTVIAILIKLDSPGPVFYRGVRVGKDGKLFKIYKFRSMVADAEEKGGPSTSKTDSRVTKIGKLIRRCKLDEFSQLINVLKGEMSMVGPRPEVRFYVDIMSEEERKTILSVRPGITDWASIWNSHEEDILKDSLHPEKIYQERIRPEKIRLQMKYVSERTFLTDLKIIFDTVLKLYK